MKDHELKCWPALFHPVSLGLKALEYRRNDRGFEVGDTLWLREYEPEDGTYTGLNCRVLVQAVWTAVDIPGLPHDFCVMQVLLAQAPWKIEPSKEVKGL